MSLHNVQNNFVTSLSSAITSTTQTTITLTATPTIAVPFYLTCGTDPLNSPSATEILEITANNAGVLTVVRGAQGSTPQTFPSGTKIQLLATAGHFNEIYFGINSSQMFPQNNLISLDGLTVGKLTLTLTPILLGSGTVTLA